MKRILAAMLAVVVVCGFGGCKADEKQTEIVSETSSTEIQYITDWSIDELLQEFELNGKTYSMPLTIGDLGEGYSIGDKASLREDNYGYYLRYNDEHFALITVDDSDTDINKWQIKSFSLSGKKYKFGDLFYKNKRTNVIDKYGFPSFSTEHGDTILDNYIFENNDSFTIHYKNNKIYGIVIGIDNEENE
ncbi:MAG: hypothetical protein IJC04_03480 [Oscillospiraceae bacterium]|nr:hypothetical protein [Oscillospiraceae bacterium]